MKKILKLSSILLLLIVACCPLILLSGCTPDSTTDAKVTLKPLTGWTFTVGSELKDGKISEGTFEGVAVTIKYNETSGKYESTTKTYNSIETAYTDGVLRGYVDTATATGTDETRSAVITFSGKSFTITYKVTAA